jgi:hypothetical protein
MTSVVAQTRSIPLRKMELLAEELRLLKSGIDLMSGRLELMLAEIAELQNEQQNTKEDLAGQTQVQSPHQAFAQPLDAAALSAASVILAVRDEAVPTTSVIAEQHLPVEPKLSPDLDAPELCVEAAPVAIVETVPLGTCGAQTTATANPETLPGAASEPSAIAAESEAVSIAPHVGGDAPNIIVLDERRKTSSRRSRNAARVVAHCAASLAMIALVVAVATSSGFAEFLVSKVRAAPDPVHIVLQAATF